MTRRSGLLKAGAAVAVGVAILVGLGSWQLSRLAWKTDLVARVHERMAADPVPAPAAADWPGLDLTRWSYRRVRLQGVYDFTKEARVFVNLPDARGPLKGPGYFIMTPLRLEDGSTVIVNRGFTPEQGGAVSRGVGGQVATVTGPLREPEDRNLFTPADQPASRMFFARDPSAIAGGLKIAGVAPFTVDAEESGPGGLPQGGETKISFPNRHLEYALTWYGLAATLAAFFGVVAWRTMRGTEDERL